MDQETRTKRRRFSKVQKKRILEAFNSGQMTCTELAGQHRISPVLIYRWRRAMGKEKQSYISNEELTKQLEEEKKKNEHLQKALSDSAIEVQILKKALEIVKKSTSLRKQNWLKKL